MIADREKLSKKSFKIWKANRYETIMRFFLNEM